MKILIILSSLFYALIASPSQRLPTKANQLYTYVYKNHLFTHKDSRFVGGWETKVYFKESFNFLSLNENSFFVPIFIMQSLDELNKYYTLPNYDKLKTNFQTYVEGFIRESIQNSEPDGTINYWRSYPVPNRPNENHYYPMDPNSFNIVESIILNMRNIPNDLDGSAQLCDWLLRSSHPDANRYCMAMVDLLSTDTYVDTPNRTQSVFDNKWKLPGSGAYLTWASTDSARIPYNANDVDCVVNLNILNGFNSVAKYISQAAIDPVRKNIDQVCTVINRVVRTGSAKVCSPYYDDTSFYWAFSKNYNNELTRECLEPSLEKVKNITIRNLLHIESSIQRRLLRRTEYFPSDVDKVDIGEVLLTAINLKLYEDPKHGKAIHKLLLRILDILLANANQASNSLSIEEGFAFRGVIHLDKQNGIGQLTGLWKSSYLSTVFALEAFLKLHQIR